jgi:hypothetical protein
MRSQVVANWLLFEIRNGAIGFFFFFFFIPLFFVSLGFASAPGSAAVKGVANLSLTTLFAKPPGRATRSYVFSAPKKVCPDSLTGG